MYWDYAATTSVKPKVLEAMMPYFTARDRKWSNPSSIYEPAREVRMAIEDAREKVAASINAEPDEIYFTSGGSESNSWVLNGFVYKNEWDQIVTTEIEHHSIQAALEHINRAFFELLPVDHFGRVNASFLENDSLISIQMANNEIGTVQDIKSLVKEIRKINRCASFHTDAVQAYGKIPIDVKDLDVDYLSASGHKIGTPKGIGFLYMRKGMELPPIIYGSQERGYRGGTENVPYIIGLGKAVELIDYSKQNKLIDKYNYLKDRLGPFATINGDPENRLWNILSATIKEPINGDMLLGMLHAKEQYVSAGSACNSYNPEPSPVLTAIGLNEDEARRTIRISLPDNVTYDEIDWLVKDIKESIEFLKMME